MRTSPSSPCPPRSRRFGDEAFWGNTLEIHQVTEGEKLGGVGPGLTPKMALAAGLKVDVEAAGIGRRLDGWANRDLNVGAIVSLAPNLKPVADLLGTDEATVKTVLASWGSGKFDAELFLDGQGFRPDGKAGATLIPPAFGLAGVNLHTWTGAWGTVTYWNAFVTTLELHCKGTFFDRRLDDPAQFPVAARAKFGHVRNDPDMVSGKLPALCPPEREELETVQQRAT